MPANHAASSCHTSKYRQVPSSCRCASPGPFSVSKDQLKLCASLRYVESISTATHRARIAVVSASESTRPSPASLSISTKNCAMAAVYHSGAGPTLSTRRGRRCFQPVVRGGRRDTRLAGLTPHRPRMRPQPEKPGSLRTGAGPTCGGPAMRTDWPTAWSPPFSVGPRTSWHGWIFDRRGPRRPRRCFPAGHPPDRAPEIQSALRPLRRPADPCTRHPAHLPPALGRSRRAPRGSRCRYFATRRSQ